LGVRILWGEVVKTNHNRPGSISRRTVLKLGAAGVAASSLGMLEALAWTPRREALAVSGSLPDIQFDIGAFTPPARDIDGVLVRFGPVYTQFVTAQLARTPSSADQQVLSAALDSIEAAYPFSPAGAFTFIAYGNAYFSRLPGGLNGRLVSTRLPRVISDQSRYVLEEAVPSPTDVSPLNPGVTKKTFNIPVQIEANDILLTVRSDTTANLTDIVQWLFAGSGTLGGRATPSPAFTGLFAVTSSRLMFQQMGLPRRVAEANQLGFADRVNSRSPMWMGFTDQQTTGAGPAPITTFQGNASAVISTASAGDYFDNGSIQHLSHVIQDLRQFYAEPDEPFTDRVQYMFRSDPIPSVGKHDQFANGGGPAFLDNVFQGSGDAERNAAGIGTFLGQRRMGHLAALQRSSRAPDGTPMHIRMDGPGFDSMDVPDGSNQPKLQFTIFVPSADFFVGMRRNQASLDLVQRYAVADDDNGIERFLTATRRQNFLVPPRRHRAFPLLELS
jgi:hypothetical protein